MFPLLIVFGGGGVVGVVDGGVDGGVGEVPPHVFRTHHLLRRGDVTMIVKMR